MDFLDPKKERRNRTMLWLGYALTALAIGIATLVLLYQSYGYSIDRQGKVTQNGLVFVSSQPSGASIYLNGSRYQANTDTRMVLPAGRYDTVITANGYRDWQRQIVVGGGDVQHFDYPFLFPKNLQTSTVTSLAAAPSLVTQSPDKRWLLLGEGDNSGTFIEYDLSTPGKPVQSELTLPSTSYNTGDGAQSWSALEWASDDRHVLLLHNYMNGTTAAHQYVLMDRGTLANSINLSATLKLSDSQVPSLFNKETNEFYIYDQAAQTLKAVTADNSATLSQLDHVLAYKTYSDNMVLYVTDKPLSGKAEPAEVDVVLQISSQATTLLSLPSGAASYALNLAQYSGDWYVAVGENIDNSVYLFKNPQNQLSTTASGGLPSPWRRLLVAHPTFVGFSDNAQFLLAEGAQHFAVYDAENIATYRYTTSRPLDPPQTHATWMDGDRLMYVSGGQVVVFDYDYRNQQLLQTASPAYLPTFAPDYSYIYAVKAAAGDAKPALTSTALTYPAK